jgi:hypothetical protein
MGCQICYQLADRFGSLVDLNGHEWRVCGVCIDALWSDRQALNLEEAEKLRQENAVEEAMRRLRQTILDAPDAT